MHCSLPGSSVHGVLQARTLEWVAISFSRGSSSPGDWTHVSFFFCIARCLLHHCPAWEVIASSPMYKWGKWGWEGLRELLKVTGQENCQIGTKVRVCFVVKPPPSLSQHNPLENLKVALGHSQRRGGTFAWVRVTNVFSRLPRWVFCSPGLCFSRMLWISHNLAPGAPGEKEFLESWPWMFSPCPSLTAITNKGYFMWLLLPYNFAFSCQD